MQKLVHIAAVRATISEIFVAAGVSPLAVKTHNAQIVGLQTPLSAHVDVERRVIYLRQPFGALWRSKEFPIQKNGVGFDEVSFLKTCEALMAAPSTGTVLMMAIFATLFTFVMGGSLTGFSF